jgi:DNA (cytosine-5)-methyltransferase 1
MTAYYNEIDPKAAATFRELIKRGAITPGEVDERSIVDVRPADLKGFSQCHFFAGAGVWSYALRLAGWDDNRPVWTGSCPCQPFSAAGKGDGFADERHLWPAWFHLIEHAKSPEVPVFGEQVASSDGLAWLDLVQTDMEGAGHALWPFDLCAAGFGAPHIRQRLYFVADTGCVPERWGAGCDETKGSGTHSKSAGHGLNGGMADHERPRLEGFAGNGNNRDQSGRLGTRPDGSVAKESAVGILGHPESGGLGERRDASQSWDSGYPDRTVCASGGLANANGGNSGPERVQRSREYGEQQEDSGLMWGRSIGIGHNSGPELERPSPVNGHWRQADWLFCRDGRWRPVEPGTFPLAHGAPERVGRLRLYGNAIVPQVAAAFIEAYNGVVA